MHNAVVICFLLFDSGLQGEKVTSCMLLMYVLPLYLSFFDGFSSRVMLVPVTQATVKTR